MKTLATFTAALLIGNTGLSMAHSMPMPMKASAPAAAAAAMPLVSGEVRKLDPTTGLIVLRHGDIPNLAMPAMTMGFEITDKKMLEGFKVGDKVRFQGEVFKGKATVTGLEPNEQSFNNDQTLTGHALISTRNCPSSGRTGSRKEALSELMSKNV